MNNIIDKIVKLFDICNNNTIVLNKDYKIYIVDPNTTVKSYYLLNMDIFSDFVLIDLNSTDIENLNINELDQLLDKEHNMIIESNIMGYKLYYNICVDLIREKELKFIHNYNRLLTTKEYKNLYKEKITQYEERIKVEIGKIELFENKKHIFDKFKNYNGKK